MADVSKIGANGIEYDVCDTAARLGVQTANTNIASLRDDLTDDEAAIAALQSAMTTAQGDISALQSADTSLQTQIDALKSTSASGYCKYADGTMIQWGTATVAMPTMTQIAASGVYYALVTLTLPQSFVNAAFSVNGNSKYSTGYQVPFGGIPASANSANVHIYDFYARASGNVVLRYTAVGRWK